MGRAPCCEKMGLKKGPWTTEEDEVLVDHIRRHGHSNWRALPKQAGLLRCGKSCRLRWINYLRPDIKRGNFSKEEEDAIIHLHEQLGNRWSAIAARLPGRTDNEIKNVWHTHLKKRLPPMPQPPASQARQNNAPKRKSTQPVSPERSFSSSSAAAESSMASSVENTNVGSSACGNEESFSSEEFQIDESFWSETLSMPLDGPGFQTESAGDSDDDMDFWRRLFMVAGDMQHLPMI